MERGRIELIRSSGLVERLDRQGVSPPSTYRRPAPVPARALDRRRHGRPTEALWRGLLVDMVS